MSRPISAPFQAPSPPYEVGGWRFSTHFAQVLRFLPRLNEEFTFGAQEETKVSRFSSNSLDDVDSTLLLTSFIEDFHGICIDFQSLSI